MNKNIDLTKILKDCPKGTKLYSTIFGDVTFCCVNKSAKYPIIFTAERGCKCSVSANGRNYVEFDGECTLFPSKDQRDWSKFTAPWYKKEKFDPKTLQPFDKVLAREQFSRWFPTVFTYLRDTPSGKEMMIGSLVIKKVIPYNDETKHLVGTNEDAPEYYRYWENQ